MAAPTSTCPRQCAQRSMTSGSLRTEPRTGNQTDLEPEPAEPDTEPEPAEPEPEKMKMLENPQKPKKVKQSIQNQKIASPHHSKSKNNIAPPRQKERVGAPWGPRAPPSLFGGWGDVIL